jgi:hypothetical protein
VGRAAGKLVSQAVVVVASRANRLDPAICLEPRPSRKLERLVVIEEQ